MKKKYILNGKIYNEEEMTGYAKKSGMNLSDYLGESGAKEHVDNNTYTLNGKDYDGNTMADYAKKSDLSYDDYIKESGAKKKELATTKEPVAGSEKPLAGVSKSTTSTGDNPGFYKEEVNVANPDNYPDKSKKIDVGLPAKEVDFLSKDHTYPVTDPFASAAKSAELKDKKKMTDSGAYAVSKETPDQESIKESDYINEALDKDGYKADFRNAVTGMTNAEFQKVDPHNTIENNKKWLLDLYKTSPSDFKDAINENKTATQIRQEAKLNAVDNPELNTADNEKGKEYSAINAANSYTMGGAIHPKNFDDFQKAITQKKDAIDTHLRGESRDAANKRLDETYGKYFTADQPDIINEYLNSDLKEKINPTQFAGLKRLEMFDKGSYEQAMSVLKNGYIPENTFSQTLSFNGDGFALDQPKEGEQESVSATIGEETVKSKLLEIGRNNTESLYSAKLDKLKKQFNILPEGGEKETVRAEAIKSQNILASLQNDKKRDDTRFPYLSQFKADDQVKEILDNRGMSVPFWMGTKFFHSMGEPAVAANDILTTLFGTEKEKSNLTLETLGSSKQFEQDTYLPESERSQNSDIIQEATPELKKALKEKLNGRSLSSLSEEEKKPLAAFVLQNQDQVKQITNPLAGERKNFASMGTVMSIAGFSTDLSAFVLKNAILGGAGMGAKMAEKIVLFGDTYASKFASDIASGKSVSDANESAMLHGGIMSAMVNVGSKYESIQNILKNSNSPISKYILGMGEDAWAATYKANKSFIERASKSLSHVAKEQGKMLAVYNVAAPLSTGVADNLFYDKGQSAKSMVSGVYDGIIDTGIGMIPLVIAGLAKGAMSYKATPLEKSMMWGFSDHPELSKQVIDEYVKNGDLTKEDGESRKKVIDDVSKTVDNIPKKNDKGKLLTDHQRQDLLYNEMVKNNKGEQAKKLPKKQAEAATSEADVAEFKNEHILADTNENGLEKRKVELEKIITPEKDSDGKIIPINEKIKLDSDNELIAVNDLLEQKKSEAIVDDKPLPQKTGQEEVQSRVDNFKNDLNSEDESVKAKAQIGLDQLQKDPIKYFEDEKQGMIDSNPDGDNTKAITAYDKIIADLKGKETDATVLKGEDNSASKGALPKESNVNDELLHEIPKANKLKSLESTGIDTGETRVDKDYDLNDAEYNQKKILKPEYSVIWDDYDSTGSNDSEKFDTLEEAHKAAQENHGFRNAGSEHYAYINLDLKGVWVDSKGEVVEDGNPESNESYSDWAYHNKDNPLVKELGDESHIYQKEFGTREGDATQLRSETESSLPSDLSGEYESDGNNYHVKFTGKRGGKYNSLEVYDAKDTERENPLSKIVLRIADHSYNPKNRGDEDGFISVNIANENKTKNKFNGKHDLNFDNSHTYKEILKETKDKLQERLDAIDLEKRKQKTKLQPEVKGNDTSEPIVSDKPVSEDKGASNGIESENKAQPQKPSIENEEPVKDKVPDTTKKNGTTDEGTTADSSITEEGKAAEGEFRGISKGYLKRHDNFVKTFETRDDKKVAGEAMQSLAQRAEGNNVSVEQQAEDEVNAIVERGNGGSSEQDIITAAYHLTDLDEKIQKESSSKNSDNTQLSLLLNKKQNAMEALRILGNSSGRNLRLFGTLFRKAGSDNIDTFRAEIKEIFDIAEVPRTVDELNKSSLSPVDKSKLLPFVQEIEKVTELLKKSKAETKKNIQGINNKAVDKYIKEEVKRKLAEQKATAIAPPKVVSPETIEARKARANKIRSWADKIEKYGKIKGFDDVKKSGLSIDVQKMVANAMRYIADKTETGDFNLKELIKDAAKKFATSTVLHPELEKEINKQVERFQASDIKDEAIQKIKDAVKDRGATDITEEMVNDGLVKKVVNDYIHSDTPSENVIAEATKELKEILPDTTEQQVTDALLRKGEFKQKTKKQLENEAQSKMGDIRRIAHAKNVIDGIENANKVTDVEANSKLSAQEKKVEIQKRKSDYEKGLDKKISDFADKKKETEAKIKKGKEEYVKLESERNRQLKKVADLTKKRDDLINGKREPVVKKEVKLDTPEIESLKKQVSEADKALKEVENALSKAKRAEENNRNKLSDIENETNYVRRERAAFDRGIKKPEAANNELKEAKKLLAEAYHEAGIRRESGGKTEINIAKEAEVEINSIKDGDLPDDVKAEHIKEIEKNRDAAIKNTKQGVLLNLRANIDNLSNKLESDKLAQKDSPENSVNIANIKQQVDRLGERLNPNDENLKDQIDKADQDLTAMIKDNTGNEFEGDLRNIRDKFRDTWQKTSDQLQRQALIDKSNSALKETERRLNSGQYTQIPTTEYDAESDLELAKLDAKEKAAYANLSAMRKKAAEKANTNTVDKLLTLRRSWLIASFGAIEKVGISAITKPIIDPFNKQTSGRISGVITGVRRTKGGLLSDTYRQFKNQGAAEAFMKSRNDDYIASIQDYEKAVNSFGADSKEAKKAQTNLLKREVANSASIAHLFINANSLVDIKQVLVNAATNLDASLGKYEKSTRPERKAEQQQQYGDNSYKKALAESGYWLEGLNRTHGAMKSVSARQGLLDGYIQNLQYFQKKEGSITEETRKLAWDKAVLSDYEIGRFGETTWASKKVSELKGGKNPIKRAVVSYALPVAKISINITKQAIDRALPLEVIVRTMGTDAMKGIKKNEADGIQYKNFIEKYGAGIKRGFDELPYEQKKYINTLISRGLAGAAQYAVVYSMISSGAIKYGGAWNTNDPYHRKYGRVIGSDGNELKNGEWEFFGHRSPLILNAALNHSPYALPASLAADWAFQTNRLDKSGNPVKNAVSNAVRTGINEVYSRLPFTTVMDIVAGLIGGDDYKAARLGASIVPGSKGLAEHFDKDKNGETVKRISNSKTFLGRTRDMAAMDIPFYRNFLPTDKDPKFFDVIDKKSGIKRQITEPELQEFTKEKKEGIAKGMKILSESKNYPANRKNAQGQEVSKNDLNFKDLTDKEKQTYITTMKNDVVKTINEKMFGTEIPSRNKQTLENSIEIKKTEIKNQQ